MAKRKKGLGSARGFGNQSILPDEELLVMSLVSQLAIDIAAQRLSELDPIRTRAEWKDWLIEEASQHLSEIGSEEELEAIFLNEAD
jgi:hypothetical protein